jgi:hypothetical protein
MKKIYMMKIHYKIIGRKEGIKKIIEIEKLKGDRNKSFGRKRLIIKL